MLLPGGCLKGPGQLCRFDPRKHPHEPRPKELLITWRPAGCYPRGPAPPAARAVRALQHLKDFTSVPFSPRQLSGEKHLKRLIFPGCHPPPAGARLWSAAPQGSASAGHRPAASSPSTGLDALAYCPAFCPALRMAPTPTMNLGSRAWAGGHPKAAEGTGVTWAVLAGDSSGCAAGPGAHGGGWVGLVPFPGQLWSLMGGPGPLSPVPKAGGALHIWVSPALCLQLQCSALVRARG